MRPYFALALAVYALHLRADPSPAEVPDAKSILAAAQASSHKLESTAISYQVVISGTALNSGVVHVLQAPDGRRRLIFCKSTFGFQSALARLVERDNIWYAT